MDRLTDQQLLRDYAERRDEAAFAELTRRQIDFVYSAALRMVRDSHLAEDVAQGVFVALAQNARQLAEHPVLSGWLHRTTQNLAANTVRTEVRRRAREQEAATMNELLAAETGANWTRIAPLLDSALGELSEPDRDALLLRYFQHLSAQEMASPLGISAEAAQKRVTRAVERLREWFVRRGVTIGAGGLVVVISANAVQAAPGGLASSISATVVTAAAVKSSTAITTAKIIAMTTLQKTLVAVGLTLVLAVTGVTIRKVSASRASKTFSSTNTLVMKWGQTAIAGGWELPSKQRAYILTTLLHGDDASQVTIRTKVVEVSRKQVIAGSNPGSISGILESNQFDLVFKKLTSGGYTMSELDIITGSGRPAVMEMQSSPHNEISIAALATISADGDSVGLNLTPTLKYSLAAAKSR